MPADNTTVGPLPDDAHDLAYEEAVPASWATKPRTVGAAFDALAASGVTIQADLESVTTDVDTLMADAEFTANKNASLGYAGLNASSRNTQGVHASDDLIVDLATKGLVLKDTQGTPHYWRVTVTTLGVLTTADLGTTAP